MYIARDARWARHVLWTLPFAAIAACVTMGTSPEPKVTTEGSDAGSADDTGAVDDTVVLDTGAVRDTGPALDAMQATDTGAPMDQSSDAGPESDVAPEDSQVLHCSTGMTACGSCTNTQIDTSNCGSCGVACIVANDVPGCQAGVCVVASCNIGFADCDHNPTNGCEAYTTTDVNNCGACGTTCASGMACVAAICVSQSVRVAIPGGTFMMGGDTAADNDMPSQPAITVSGFTMDAFEVTVGRFRLFWTAGHPVPPTDPVMYPGGSMPWGGPVTEPETTAITDCTWSESPGSMETHPINCVDWYTAQAFCVWDGGRLPTESEWEYAARGMSSVGLMPERIYPWGSTDPAATCDRAEWNECAGDDGTATRRIGSFAPTAGLYDLAGNVWELTADWYAAGSDTMCWNAITRTNPICNNNASGFRVLRGGAEYSYDDTHLRSASRIANTTNYSYNDTGFRCVRPTPTM